MNTVHLHGPREPPLLSLPSDREAYELHGCGLGSWEEQGTWQSVQDGSCRSLNPSGKWNQE